MKIRSHGLAIATAAAAALGVGGGMFALDRATLPVLEVPRVSGAPTLDGRADDPVWAEASPVEIETESGANLGNGTSLVEVSAVATAEEIFFKFRWEDPTRSFKHLPLRKTEAGWRVMQMQYDIEDEDGFYEDKFGVLFNRSPEIGGGGTVHMGPHPHAGLPESFGGRGLHYTVDGSIADLWHWKSVRSQPSGIMDDNSFGPPVEPKPEEIAGTSRYKAGYATDPGKAAYSNNFEHQGPGGYREPIQPKRLPADLAALQRRIGPVDLDLTVNDRAPIYMTEAESVPYSPELDAAIPVDTVIPGVLIADKPWEGDRADVRSSAQWEDGHWTLEVSRKLITGSKVDLPFAPEEQLYFWVSVFDHTQTRHSRHMRPVELRLEPARAEG
jgi:Ethylbenzene dehydrogenase